MWARLLQSLITLAFGIGLFILLMVALSVATSSQSCIDVGPFALCPR